MNDRTIYCVKTGQPVGTMHATYQYHPMAVHSDWTSTDGTSLDQLQRSEPRAYVAFCLGLVDNFWRSTCHRSRKRQEATEHHWALVRTYALLADVPEPTLIELSHTLCRFITYAPLSYRVLDQKLIPGKRAADLMAENAVAGALLGNLNKAITATLTIANGYSKAGASIKTPKFEILPDSIEDAAKGPSHIRSQQTSRDYHKNAKKNKMLADILRLLGWNDKPAQPQRPQSSALLERLSKQGAAIDRDTMPPNQMGEQEMDMFVELERMMTGSVSSYVEDDDDTVEIRTIPRQLVESMNMPAPIQAEPPTQSTGAQEQPSTVKPQSGLLARLQREYGNGKE